MSELFKLLRELGEWAIIIGVVILLGYFWVLTKILDAVGV
jgi:hypothetical protein